MTWLARDGLPIRSSPEVVMHHLEQHACHSAHYNKVTYRCGHDGHLASALECAACGATLAVHADNPLCEHLPELLTGLGVAA